MTTQYTTHITCMIEADEVATITADLESRIAPMGERHFDPTPNRTVDGTEYVFFSTVWTPELVAIWEDLADEYESVSLNPVLAQHAPSTFPPLPEQGEPVEGGQIYQHGDGLVMARQSHLRTEHAPEDVLALFVVYRANAEGLEWVPSETVALGALREYQGEMYRARQGHTTEEGWQPPNVPALWDLVETPEPDEPEPEPTPDEPDSYPTFSAGIDVEVGDIYIYEGVHYRCRQAHPTADHWSPPAVASLWLPVVNVNVDDSARLQTLSGVGAATAQAIIDGRPYATVDDLTAISGITQSAVDGWDVIV